MQTESFVPVSRESGVDASGVFGQENTSGQGKGAVVPEEIKKWNWGAFLWSGIWGIGNKTYIALLVGIPYVGPVVMPFVLGFKGSEWAWQNKRWESVEQFKKTQRKWALWGFILIPTTIFVFAILWWGVFFFSLLGQ